jgi:hypothetical protein
VFIGVAENDREKPWSAYIEKSGMNWPQYLDTTGKMAILFRVVSYPTYIIIDRDGVVRARQSEYMPGKTPGWIEDEIKKTLKTKGSW